MTVRLIGEGEPVPIAPIDVARAALWSIVMGAEDVTAAGIAFDALDVIGWATLPRANRDRLHAIGRER